MRFPIFQDWALESVDAGLCDVCAEVVEAREREATEGILGLLPHCGWAAKCRRAVLGTLGQRFETTVDWKMAMGGP